MARVDKRASLLAIQQNPEKFFQTLRRHGALRKDNSTYFREWSATSWQFSPNAVSDMITYYQKVLAAFDMERLSNAETRVLFKLYVVQIPALVEKISRLALRYNNTSRVIYKTRKRLSRYGEKANSLRFAHSKRLYLVAPTPAIKVEAEKPALVARVSEGTFPELYSISPEVDEALATLRGHWQSISHQTVTVEDRYFLEQVVSTYLPELWQLHETLHDGPEDALQQGSDLLLAQLRTLDEQVAAIVGQSAESTLNALEAYGDFLRQRASQNRLTLPEV